MNKNRLTEMVISGRRIAEDEPPYLIAEISANHNGSLDEALSLLASAKENGADAVKLQTYTPDTITLNSQDEDFLIRGGQWDGMSLYEFYRATHTPWEWHKPLFEYAKEIGITIFSSPFDATAVDLLVELNAPAYKIASFEIVDLPLIKYVAKTGKPMIISTGMASLNEIEEAVNAAYLGGCKELALLRCVSGYPAPPSDYNLNTILDMRTRFNVQIGLSDHTLNDATAIASVGLGATIVEKHFTLDRNSGGPDDSFSIEPRELAKLSLNLKNCWEALGRITYGPQASEIGNVKFRRSLYFVRDIKKGELISEGDIRSVRPGHGVSPKYLGEIIGRVANCDVSRNSPVTWECFV